MNEIALRLAARLFDAPVIENQFRSAFIEAMIEPLLETSGWRYAGANWAGWDFDHTDGTRLEVKQSAAQQTWSQVRPSRGAFDIAARQGYFEGGSVWTVSPRRQADIYVFAWNPVYGPEVDQRDPRQWEFFVFPANALPNQKTVSLSTLRSIIGGIGPVEIGDIAANVDLLRLACP